MDHVRPPPHTPRNSYISIYFGHKPLFSQYLMIIITGTFRNTSNPLKLYEIILFSTGSSAYCYVYESDASSSCWWYMNFKCVPRAKFLNFHRRDLKFSAIVSNTITIMHWNYKKKCKIYKISHYSPLKYLFCVSSSVSFSYFVLAVPMRKCLGKHSCMSSSFPIVILNDTSFFRQCNYKCTMRIWRDIVEIRMR